MRLQFSPALITSSLSAFHCCGSSQTQGEKKGKSHLFLLCTFQRVDEWMAKEGLLDPNVKSIFVTCGDWDLKVM